MQTYQYSAISRDGAKVNGVVEAVDEYEAAAKIRQTCIAITKIQAAPEKKKGVELFPYRVKDKALAMMCSQFAIILGSGIPVVRAISLIADQTQDKKLKQLLREVADDVAQGQGLARSFERRGDMFPLAFIESIRAGEESGTLDESFRRLEKYYSKAAKTRGKVRAAMTYPVFTILVAVVVVAIIMVKAVPTFVSSFLDMGIDLPWPTKLLIAVSNFFTRWWFLLAMLLMLGVLFWQLWGHTEDGALTQTRFKLRLPVLGRLHLMRLCGQFAETMSTLLTAGIPLVRALDNTAEVLDFAVISKAMNEQLPKLEEGKTLAVCLQNVPFLPSLLVEMVGIGEETGTLENTLSVVGDYYDNEAELASQKVLSMMEPIIICVLAVIVVLILLAVYLPMFSLYAAY